MHKKILTAVAAAFLATVGLAAPANAISATTANLYVLHAVPNTPVDVYVDGSKALSNFQPGTLTDALDLPAGDHVVVITAVGAPIGSPVIGPATLSLAANTSYTVVAHLKADGTPTATLFTNDLSKIPAGQGKLTVRHTAAAPAVDILANGAVAFPNLTNPNEVKANLPVGTISAQVNLAGTATKAIGPADVQIQEGVNTIVYAWGSAQAGNLALAVQTIGGLHSNPVGVNTGEAGLAADPNPADIGAGVAALLAMLIVGGVVTVRTKRAAAARR